MKRHPARPPTGERGTDDARERLRQVEQREHLAAVTGRDPGRQEQDRAGEEAGLGDAEQEAQADELRVVLHPREEQGHDAPRDHDAGEPDTRAELVQREVGRHLEHEVADEEHTGREAELGGGQAEVGLHAVGGGEGDRGAVEEVDEEHQCHERHDADRDLADGRLLDDRGGDASRGGDVHDDSCSVGVVRLPVPAAAPGRSVLLGRDVPCCCADRERAHRCA
jgi:hypothetical protein